ncbi:MAG TPA: acid phosphatase [Rhodanobacteraceae bacterium]|nr:acid phosphatase [Rhodanobacteraceae bacterium]
MSDRKSLPPSADDTPQNPSRRRLLGSMAAAGVALAAGCHSSSSSTGGTAATAGSSADAALDKALRERIRHVVVVFCENRSFNNLFADFPGLEQPLSSLPPERFAQRDRDGSLFKTLPPIWRGLVPHEQTLDGKTYRIGEDAITGLANAPWKLRTPDGQPLPHALVTSSPVHVFYRNQMQINGGKNDGFVAWGDHGALPMGWYDTNASNFKLWQLAREYTLLDNFFMGAFGGSFLNHQYLVTAQPPIYPNADQSPAKLRIAVLDDGPTGYRLKLADDSPASAMDGVPKFASHASLTPDFHAVNTFGPPYQPSWNTDPDNPQLADLSSSSILPPQEHLTIGDTLSAKGVDWAWYSGAWQMALDGKGDQGINARFPISPNFQAHHQPLNYFRQFAPGTAARKAHLRDGGTGSDASTNRFLADIEAGRLPAVSFYKPQGNLNMHAGYADVAAGDQHITDVIAALKASPLWKDTMVIVTVDENGGWWDHVAPPKADRWGPGTRIPALVISPHAKKGHVEHAVHDTGSIQRFLNRRFGLNPLPGIVLRDEAMRKHSGFAPGDLTATLDLT